MSDMLQDFERAQRGDDWAWTTLFQAFYPRAVAAAEPICPAWCEPEDLASDAFHRLVRECDQLDFKSIDELTAWLEAEVQRIGSSR